MPLPAPSGSIQPGSRRVPPSWFLTTSTVCSSPRGPGYCTWLTTMGFTTFLLACEARIPVVPLCPPKPCSPPVATMCALHEPRAHPAGVTATWFPFGTPRTPPTLPSRSFFLANTPRLLAARRGDRNPRALLHRQSRSEFRGCPLRPADAPMGLPAPTPPAQIHAHPRGGASRGHRCQRSSPRRHPTPPRGIRARARRWCPPPGEPELGYRGARPRGEQPTCRLRR